MARTACGRTGRRAGPTQLRRGEAEEVGDDDQLPVILLRHVQRPADVRQGRDHRIDCERVERHQSGQHHRHLARAGALYAVLECRIRTWEGACWPIEPCRATVGPMNNEATRAMRMRRRTFLETGGSGFLAAGIASLTGISSVAGARRTMSG